MNALTEQVLEFARSWGAALVGVATRETLWREGRRRRTSHTSCPGLGRRCRSPLALLR